MPWRRGVGAILPFREVFENRLCTDDVEVPVLFRPLDVVLMLSWYLLCDNEQEEVWDVKKEEQGGRLTEQN